MIKPILQNASDQINNSKFEDGSTIQITKNIASLYKKTVEAISLHEYRKSLEAQEKEKISGVSAKDIKNAMNREMID